MGALPTVSFNFNYLLLQWLLGKLVWNLARAIGMGTNPSAGPGCLVVKGLFALPMGWFCQSLTILCAEPFANLGLGRGSCLELAGKSSLSWDGLCVCPGDIQSVTWWWLKVTGTRGMGGRQREAVEIQSGKEYGAEGLSWRKRKGEGSDLGEEGSGEGDVPGGWVVARRSGLRRG